MEKNHLFTPYSMLYVLELFGRAPSGRAIRCKSSCGVVRCATLRHTAGFPLLSLTRGLIIFSYYMTFLQDVNGKKYDFEKCGKIFAVKMH
ncbi:MAG: hypothetical protein LBB41_07795 [Prevotellaceae bacterium]|jgi:hypothetical protein|nr:hypothetical protein [Prevotellaceae bacterium]